jgi:cyclic-di-GMP-binding protein
MNDLTLPERTPPSDGAFDTRPARVEAWLATLPMANVGETTRQLYRALREVNALDISPSQRLKFLESVRPVLGYVSDAMKKHYVGRSFPLPDKSRTVARLARELRRQSALGYAIVAHDESRKGRLRRDKGAIGTAIHRAMRCFGAVLLNAYQVYAPYPDRVWGELHHLLRLAVAHNVDRVIVKDERYEEVKASSVTDAYKEAVLLALTCPYRLRQGEVEQVHRALERWAPHARLLDFAEPANPSGIFMINLESDSPPSYLVLQHRPEDTGNCRLLETAELADIVRAQLSAPRAGKQVDKAGLPASVLRRLMLAWGVMPKRRYSRTSKHSSVMATVGLSAAHFFISGEMVFSPTVDEADTGERGGGENAYPVYDQRAHFVAEAPASERGQSPDIWDLHRHNSEPTPATLSLEPEESGDDQNAEIHYDAQPWKMINVSAGGYCLLWDNDDASGAQVGELIAVREQTDPDQFHWGLGVIRWMKWIENHGLELGVQMLSPGAVAVGLKGARGKGRSPGYVRSLLLPEIRAIGQPATLLTPALPYRVDDTVTVYSHGKETRVRLTKMVENTGTFAQFHFSPLETRSGRPRTGNGSQDPDFDAIWDSI